MKKSINRSLSLEDRCDRCFELVKSRARIVKGYGDLKAKYFFIGLAPGRNGADITGVPFTKDPSGVLFQEALIYADFSAESNPNVIYPKLRDVYITNLVKCNPQDEYGRNRDPTIEEILNCKESLHDEISLVSPEYIILLGSIVTKYFMGVKNIKMKELHGKLIEKEGQKYIPFLHPSYVIRGAYNKDKYLEDFLKIKDF